MMIEHIEVFEKNVSKIILGDAIKVLSTLPDESIDLIFADPPYNIGKNFSRIAPDKIRRKREKTIRS
jgi:DNA modification methylase